MPPAVPMSCPARVRIVSWNLWLIPFGGPWCLGRVQAIERCLCRHVGSMLADPGVEDCLVIAALQEAWAWRAGPLYPLVWLEAALQKRLLSSLFRGDREPLALRAIFALSRVVQLAGALVTSVCAPPLLRAVLWSPKPVLAASLRRAGLPHATAAGEASFRHAGWPRESNRSASAPCLLDCGLLLCTSRPPDETGFEPFDWRGNAECVAHKGMEWVRFGGLAVLTTHMTFEYADGGVQRGAQQLQLARLAARLLDEGAEQLLLVGDLNSALPHQTLPGRRNGPRPSCATPPSVYEKAWLGSHASLDRLHEAFEAVDADLELRRMDTGEEPTCEDGTVDHVLCCARRSRPPGGVAYRAATSSTVVDPRAEVSDHALVRCELEWRGGSGT